MTNLRGVVLKKAQNSLVYVVSNNPQLPDIGFNMSDYQFVFLIFFPFFRLYAHTHKKTGAHTDYWFLH